MIKSTISLPIITLIVFFSCKKNTLYNGYSKIDDGYYYKLIQIGDDLNKEITNNDVLVFSACMRTQNDSVFWDTKHDAITGLCIANDINKIHKSGVEYLLRMTIGDSVSILVNPKPLFLQYFNSSVPTFCSKDSLLKIDIRLLKIITKQEYNRLNNKLTEDTELKELKLIDQYISKYHPKVKVDNNGLYLLEKTNTNLEAVEKGKRITIEYKSYHLDGKPIESNPQSFEMIYGTPDQLIKGLNIVISTMKKGETSKIIIPSRLAFGEQGSSNGSVAPYTPIIYELKINDIKINN